MDEALGGQRTLLRNRDRHTFWRAFSFSSRLCEAVSRLVCVCASSFSSCCIFFSSCSTSSFAFRGGLDLEGRKERRQMAEDEKTAHGRIRVSLRFHCVSRQCLRFVFVAFRSNFGEDRRSADDRMKERKRKGRGLEWGPGGADSRSGGPSPSPRGAGWRS